MANTPQQLARLDDELLHALFNASTDTGFRSELLAEMTRRREAKS